MKGIWKRLQDWYRGPFIPPEDHPHIFFMGHHEQPPLAKVLGWLGRFWLDHWKWIIGTVIAIFALVLKIV